MTETTYGIISDTHENPRIVEIAMLALKREAVNKLIINGDIGSGQQHIAFTLENVGRSGLEAFVQPGSHETLADYEPVIRHFSEKYSNLVNVFENPKIELNGHHLVFLPGSDWTCGGQYQLLCNDATQSGFYKTQNGALRVINMNDLRSLVTDPDKTIVVSHVPRKFNDIEICVDMAYFGEFANGSVSPGFLIEEQIRRQTGKVSPDEIREIAAKNGISLKRENRGNEQLRYLYEEIGITKSVTGHFHESVHRANNRQSKHVPEGELVDELFWNASYTDKGNIGILTVNDAKVMYRNIDLRSYVEKLSD